MYRAPALFRRAVITPDTRHNGRHTHPLSISGPAIRYSEQRTGQTNKNTRSNVTFPREDAPRLSFMTTIGDTNHQTEDGINLVTSGTVTSTAGHTSRPLIGPDHGTEASDWPVRTSDVSKCLIFVEERRVSSVIPNQPRSPDSHQSSGRCHSHCWLIPS